MSAGERRARWSTARGDDGDRHTVATATATQAGCPARMTEGTVVGDGEEEGEGVLLRPLGAVEERPGVDERLGVGEGLGVAEVVELGRVEPGWVARGGFPAPVEPPHATSSRDTATAVATPAVTAGSLTLTR
jgi:hypothetical protein